MKRPQPEERRWVDVKTFAAYLGVSERQVWRMVAADEDVRAVTKRVGRRVLICLFAWKLRVEQRMVA